MRAAWLLCICGILAALVALNWAQLRSYFDSQTPPATSSQQQASAPPLAAPASTVSATPSPPRNFVAATPAVPTRPSAKAPAQSATTVPPATLQVPAPTKAEKQLLSGAQQMADAPPAVLEQTPASLLAQTLAQTLAQMPNDALQEIDPQTLEKISTVLDRAAAAELTPKAAAKAAAKAVANSPGPIVRTTATGVTITPLAPTTAPTALPIERISASPAPLAPESSKTARSALPIERISASPAPLAPESSKTARLSAAAERVLTAPAAALEAVPRKLLAQALTGLSANALMQSLSATLQAEIPAALSAAEAEVKLTVEARAYISEIITPVLTPINATGADHFVRPTQQLELSLPSSTTTQSVQALLDAGVDVNAPISVVRISHKLEPLRLTDYAHSTPEKLAAPVQVLNAEQIVQMPLSQALRQYQLEPTQPITLVREVRYLEPTTIAQLRQSGELEAAQLPRVMATPATVSQQTLEQILGMHKAEDPDSVYYIRTVQRTDVQGIWGIIQSGLIENFARGMAIRRGTSSSTFRVDIPRLADEPLAGQRGSSFLGRLLYRKAQRSTLYNIRLGKIVDRPETIQAGQQIVIVDFTPSELIDIYRHFARSAATTPTSAG